MSRFHGEGQWQRASGDCVGQNDGIGRMVTLGAERSRFSKGDEHGLEDRGAYERHVPTEDDGDLGAGRGQPGIQSNEWAAERLRIANGPKARARARLGSIGSDDDDRLGHDPREGIDRVIEQGPPIELRVELRRAEAARSTAGEDDPGDAQREPLGPITCPSGVRRRI